MIKDYFDSLKKEGLTYWYWLTRHTILIVSIILAYFILKPDLFLLESLFDLILIMTLVIILSNISLFLFAKNKNDEPFTKGAIYLGNCILTGLIILGIYFVKFSGPGAKEVMESANKFLG